MRIARRVLAACAISTVVALATYGAEPASSSYDDLTRLFAEWRAFQRPAVVDGVPDYTAAAMEKQRARLPEFQRRLAAIDPSGWPIARRVDHHLVRAEMNGLDFDHRVLKPWSRNPCFYAVVIDEESDTPAKEGPAFAGALPLFTYSFPLSAEQLPRFRTQLRAIPRILQQARKNLTGDARDLWLLGVRVQKAQGALLAGLGKTLAAHHPDLVADADAARAAVDGFREWLEAEAPGKKGPSGVGVADYDWFMKNVQLVPFGWRDEATLMRRELARSTAALALERHRNRELPQLTPIASAEEFRKRFGAAVDEYVRFLGEKKIFTVTPDVDPALHARGGPFIPPDSRDFFAQVDARDPLLMRLHGMHWIDHAHMKRSPHPSVIRRGALLYNMWAGRAEGLATAMEEMMMTAGLFDAHPRSRELVEVLVANRAARGLAGLLQQSRELTTQDAVLFAHDNTPNGWLKKDGDLAWGEQQNYLEQPGYGSSYLTGKAQIEQLLADRARQLGDRFDLTKFMDDLQESGMIPVSMIRWEMTGRDDEVKALTR